MSQTEQTLARLDTYLEKVFTMPHPMDKQMITVKIVKHYKDWYVMRMLHNGEWVDLQTIHDDEVPYAIQWAKKC